MPSVKARTKNPSPCSIDGCTDPVLARKMCSRHYWRWKRHGDPQHVERLDIRGGYTVEDRFWHYTVTTPSGHWIWTGAVVTHEVGRDYGIFFDGESQQLAHRWSYGTLVEPIPEGFVIDHLCCFCRCVNPQHLQAVPQGVNVRRGGISDHGTPVSEFLPQAGRSAGLANAVKTHCPEGHQYDGRAADGTRFCRTCRKAYNHAYAKAHASGIGSGGVQRAKTHCPKGHEYTSENTYYRPVTGNRDCKKCRRERNERSRRKLRAS